MKKQMPLRLKKDPLIEVVWEIRFTSTTGSISDLLPGLLFKELSKEYPRIERQPAAYVPEPIAKQEPALRYAPRIRLEGEHQAILIGEHVVALSRRRPYSGWVRFSEEIKKVIQIIDGTGLIKRLERFSLKYIDLLVLGDEPRLTCLNVEMKLGKHDLNNKPVRLYTEIVKSDLTHIVQIVSPAKVLIPDSPETIKGVLLDIDTIKSLGENEKLSDVEKYLEMVHASSKEMFFSLLTGETLTKLEPEYGDV